MNGVRGGPREEIGAGRERRSRRAVNGVRGEPREGIGASRERRPRRAVNGVCGYHFTSEWYPLASKQLPYASGRQPSAANPSTNGIHL